MTFLIGGKEGGHHQMGLFGQRDRIFQVIAIVILGFAVGEKSDSSYYLGYPGGSVQKVATVTPITFHSHQSSSRMSLGNAQVKSLSSCTKLCSVSKGQIYSALRHMSPSCQCNLLWHSLWNCLHVFGTSRTEFGVEFVSLTLHQCLEWIW